jgi:hypothetical protein
MTISDTVMVFAVLLAPFLAVFAQKQIEKWRERRGTKLWIFKTLMATRRATLSPNHVQALNMIDLEFSGKSRKEREVKRIWREFLDHLGSLPQDKELQRDAIQPWQSKNEDYLADLLVAMGKCFGYNFDRVYIKKGIYSPEGHAKDELENRAIRFLLLELLQGKRSIPTDTKLIPADEDAADFGKKLQHAISEFLAGQATLPVEIRKSRSQEAE